ncbi:MAG: phospholipase D family protein [Lewinellaceae bacterium]|nr:phospholipase D family protein [Saprospiraceae bacterium]MCB9337803.1 phospholipase D family protein [Lewinellaceae bacterium]
MKTITSKLSDNLKNILKTSDEIWVAVALLNLQGFDFIFQTINENCKINLIVGIDLPTDPSALTNILSFKTKHTISAYVFTMQVFHPKVYIVRTGNHFKSFVGSANCTRGGLETNVEMTIEVDNQETSEQLLAWYFEIQKKAQILDADFIDSYKPIYENRLERGKKDKCEINNFKAQKIRSKIQLDTSIQDLLIGASKELTSLFERLNAAIVEINPKINSYSKNGEILYKTSINFVALRLAKRKNQIRVILRTKDEEIYDPKRITGKVPENYRWGYMNRITFLDTKSIGNHYTLQDIIDLIVQSYNATK